MDDRDKEKKIEPEKFCRSFLKKAVQRMKKLTKYTPEKTFTIEKNGFHGTYYKPEKNFVYPYRHLHYRTASHYLCPAKPLTAKLFRVERKQPQACDESREKAFEDTMKFLKEEWK